MEEVHVYLDRAMLRTLQTVCGEARAEVIARTAAGVIKQNMEAHEALAMSGAMRWPPSMRPECGVVTQVSIA